jgi:hypothetical protein
VACFDMASEALSRDPLIAENLPPQALQAVGQAADKIVSDRAFG